MSHSFDTSSLIEMKNNYPEDVFPTIWKRFQTSVEMNEILVSEEVISELSTGTDGLDQRIKSMGRAVIKTDTLIEREVKTIMQTHPNLVDIKRLKSVGDPYVIAVAKVYRGAVVTQESTRPNKVKIPQVCQHYGIECSNLLEYMRTKKWQF